MENPGNRADKLIERILGEAEADAKAARDKAAESCRAVMADCDKKIAERANIAAAARDTAVKGVLDGARTRAELDGRKETLSVRRRILDEAFAAATKELNALTGSRREAILLRGGSYEKDCSLNALMAELRLKEETNAARILFT